MKSGKIYIPMLAAGHEGQPAGEIFLLEPPQRRGENDQLPQSAAARDQDFLV